MDDLFDTIYLQICNSHSNGEHTKQVSIVIIKFCNGLSLYEMNETLDIFCFEYTTFNNNNGPFYSGGFICSSKYI